MRLQARALTTPENSFYAYIWKPQQYKYIDIKIPLHTHLKTFFSLNQSGTGRRRVDAHEGGGEVVPVRFLQEATGPEEALQSAPRRDVPLLLAASQRLAHVLPRRAGKYIQISLCGFFGVDFSLNYAFSVPFRLLLAALPPSAHLRFLRDQSPGRLHYQRYDHRQVQVLR